MNMLSADEASLVMEPAAGSFLPWPGTSETAGASSSSSGGGVTPQLMDFEPDLTEPPWSQERIGRWWHGNR